MSTTNLEFWIYNFCIVKNAKITVSVQETTFESLEKQQYFVKKNCRFRLQDMVDDTDIRVANVVGDHNDLLTH